MMQTSGEIFGSVLQLFRQATGMTQHALAGVSGYSRVYIGMLERGERAPNLALTERLALALGLSTSDRDTFFQAAQAASAPPTQPREEDVAPLQGRVSEIQKLERHLRGNGRRLLLLAGEPGMGASRLLHEAQALCEHQRWRVVMDSCRAIDPSFANPLHALLRQLAACHNSKPHAHASQTRLILDDLHLAPPALLDMLGRLLRAPGYVNVICLAAYQTTFPPNSPLPPFLHEVAGEGLTERLSLTPLASDVAASLLDALLGGVPIAPQVTDHVLARAEGIPGYLAAFAHTIKQGGGLPDSLDDSRPMLPWELEQQTLHRLAQLAPDAQYAVQVVALAGGDAEVALIQHVLCAQGVTETDALAAIDAAHTAGFFTFHPSPALGLARCAIAHHVLREAIQANLPHACAVAIAHQLVDARAYA